MAGRRGGNFCSPLQGQTGPARAGSCPHWASILVDRLEPTGSSFSYPSSSACVCCSPRPCHHRGGPFLPFGEQKLSGLRSTGMSRSLHRPSWPLLSSMAVAPPTTFCQKTHVERFPWRDRVLVTHWAQVALLSAQGTLRSGSSAALRVSVL